MRVKKSGRKRDGTFITQSDWIGYEMPGNPYAYPDQVKGLKFREVLNFRTGEIFPPWKKVSDQADRQRLRRSAQQYVSARKSIRDQRNDLSILDRDKRQRPEVRKKISRSNLEQTHQSIISKPAGRNHGKPASGLPTHYRHKRSTDVLTQRNLSAR